MNKKKRNELNRIRDIMKLYECSFIKARDYVRGQNVNFNSVRDKWDNDDLDYYENKWTSLVDINYKQRF